MLRSVLKRTTDEHKFCYRCFVCQFEGSILLLFSGIDTCSLSIDNSLSIVKRSAILHEKGPLKKGVECQIKERSKVHQAKIGRIKIGKPAFQSVEINNENLSPYELVLKKYPSLCKQNVVGTLTVKLANEIFFENEVLKKCTIMGCREYPALPMKELNELKLVIFSLFPCYWNNQTEYKLKIWKSCGNAIGQLCKRLRDKCET